MVQDLSQNSSSFNAYLTILEEIFQVKNSENIEKDSFLPGLYHSSFCLWNNLNDFVLQSNNSTTLLLIKFEIRRHSNKPFIDKLALFKTSLYKVHPKILSGVRKEPFYPEQQQQEPRKGRRTTDHKIVYIMIQYTLRLPSELMSTG